MELSPKDRRAIATLSSLVDCNMNILAVERRFDLLPRELKTSKMGGSLQKIFEKRDQLEDKAIGENKNATDSKFANLSLNRRNIYMKALFQLQQNSVPLIVELESRAWQSEHPSS
jgi:hypothetical protein